MAQRPALPDAVHLSAPPGVFWLPRRPAPMFVGRERVLGRLDAAFRSGVEVGVLTQAVFGLGEIGKSELALHYADEHRSEYALAWWIDADSPAQIQTGLAALARAIASASASTAAGQLVTLAEELGCLPLALTQADVYIARTPGVDAARYLQLLRTVPGRMYAAAPVGGDAARANFAAFSGRAGDAPGARDQFTALLPIIERVLGPEHPDTITARGNLARWTEKAK